MADQDDRSIFFVNADGEELGSYSPEELAAAGRALLAEVLERPDDRNRVREYIAGLTLVDGIPAPLVLGSALETVVVEILGQMAVMSDQSGGQTRELLQSIARRFRDGESGA